MRAETLKATDRRVQRTRRMLREALIALILERGWDKISVQDVCERADVGRSTFYNHFTDKEELLLSGFDELRRALRPPKGAKEWARAGALGFAHGMIEHVQEHRRLACAIIGKRSGLVVQKRLRQLLLDLVREELAGIAPAGPRLEATAHYIAGAFFELITWWIDSRNRLQPADLEEIFHQLTTPVLAALRDDSTQQAPRR